MVGFFFGGEGNRLSESFLWNRIVLIKIYPKNDFFEILPIFLDRANIFDHFSDKSLPLENRA